MTDRNENLRFTLRHLFVVTALSAMALAAGRVTGSPALTIHLTLVVVGWLIYYVLHGHLAGILPCLLGADYLTIHAIDWTYRANAPFMFEPVLDMFASFLIFVGLGIFVILGCRKGPYWRWQLANAAIFFTLLIAWWLVIPMIGERVIAQQRARDTVRNNAAMSQAVAQVEAIRSQLGRVPTDLEFGELSKAPLPTIYWDGRKIEMDYRYVSDKEYWLSYLLSWDIYSYHSTEPKRGWFSVPF